MVASAVLSTLGKGLLGLPPEGLGGLAGANWLSGEGEAGRARGGMMTASRLKLLSILTHFGLEMN